MDPLAVNLTVYITDVKVLDTPCALSQNFVKPSRNHLTSQNAMNNGTLYNGPSTD